MLSLLFFPKKNVKNKGKNGWTNPQYLSILKKFLVEKRQAHLRNYKVCLKKQNQFEKL